MMFGGILLIIVVFYLLQQDQHPYQSSYNQSSHQSALDILNERYVNGEIDEEDYLRKKRLIKTK